MRGDEVQRRVQSMTVAKFQRTYRCLWLVGEIDEEGQPQQRATASFHTEPEPEGEVAPAEFAPAAAFQENPSRFALHPIGKSAQNPWHERVTFGRARNNDIVLSHPSVSKLHGYFQVEPSDGVWRIHDVGSRNPLRVDGVEVPTRGNFVVRSGAQLTIGAHAYEIMDSARVHELLASLDRP